MTASDRTIIRNLASQAAELAALPINGERRRLWRKLNALEPERPMVMIDQVCWHEMNPGELALRCEDAELRDYERRLRRAIYQWNHFQVDMVMEPFIHVEKAIRNTGFGIAVTEQRAETDPDNDVVSHLYENQFVTDEDIERVRMPVVSHDEIETTRRLAVAHELFDGILEVLPWGADPYLSLWDPVATWMGVETALFALIDRPGYVHRLVGRMTEGYLSMLDQLESQGLLSGPQSLIHCTGAFTDELPAADYDPERPRTKDMWMFGLAQMFSSVSPDMFREFEVEYASRICDRFGLVYYGCCDPLDTKMAEVRMIPNVRKVSMSPWANQERGAHEIAGDYVFSRKPNPAFVATDSFDEDLVRADLADTKAICDRNGCPLEFILKDISTVAYRPERLTAWAEIAMRVAGG